MADVPLEDRVDDAFPPNERDRTHLASLDIREARDVGGRLTQQLRRLFDGTMDLP